MSRVCDRRAQSSRIMDRTRTAGVEENVGHEDGRMLCRRSTAGVEQNI
jgi:hypothetical protein